MTGPQRRPATRGAFPEPGPVMRRPGGSPVLAVSRSGAQWKADKSGALLAEQGSCFSRCCARPSELASDGRVKSRTLAGGPGRPPSAFAYRESRRSPPSARLARSAFRARREDGGLESGWCRAARGGARGGVSGARTGGAAAGVGARAVLATSPPSPSPPRRRRGGDVFFAVGYPGWRSCLADPGLLS